MDPEVINGLSESQEDVAWVPLTLTLVEYPKGDHVGKLLALFSLIPFAIIAGFVTLILFRRDLHTISFFAGVIFNELVNNILKNTICELRPMTRKDLYTEYGMPSAHSQFMWFFTAYVAYFVFFRLYHMNNNSIMSALWKIVIVIGCVSLTAIVCFSRVYLSYHSLSQVSAGALVGVLVATLWFTVTQRLLSPLFPHIVTWRISELLMLRDTTLIPNVMWFEYTTARQEARARLRKLAALKPVQ